MLNKMVLMLTILLLVIALSGCAESRESRIPLDSETFVYVIENRNDIEWDDWTYNASGYRHNQALAMYLLTLDVRYRIRFAEFISIAYAESEYNAGVSNLRRRADIPTPTETDGRNFNLAVLQNETNYILLYRIENTLLVGELRLPEYIDEFIDLINELKAHTID